VDGQEKTIHAINMKRTPLVRTVSQANIDAARRIDFNRIRGERAGGAEDRIQQPLLINEEQKRRRIITEMEIVGAQSEEQKRDNRNLQINNRKRKQRKQRLNEKNAQNLNAILSLPVTETTCISAPTTPSHGTHPLNTIDLIENKRTDTANTANGYTDQEGIMLSKTPQCAASIPDENKITTEPETNQNHCKQRRRKPKVSITIPKTLTEPNPQPEPDVAEKIHGHFTRKRSERKFRNLDV
jgi:phage-related minor tail protein